MLWGSNFFVREFKKNIAVAGERRAVASEILAAKLRNARQQFSIAEQPATMLRNDCCAISVWADDEWIAPDRRAPDVDDINTISR